MIFSLTPISENSEIRLNTLPLFPVIVESSELQLGDRFTYRFCDEISKVCGSFRLIPETGSLVLDYDGFCQVVSKSDVIINTLVSDLEITRQSAL